MAKGKASSKKRRGGRVSRTSSKRGGKKGKAKRKKASAKTSEPAAVESEDATAAAAPAAVDPLGAMISSAEAGAATAAAAPAVSTDLDDDIGEVVPEGDLEEDMAFWAELDPELAAELAAPLDAGFEEELEAPAPEAAAESTAAEAAPEIAPPPAPAAPDWHPPIDVAPAWEAYHIVRATVERPETEDGPHDDVLAPRLHSPVPIHANSSSDMLQPIVEAERNRRAAQFHATARAVQVPDTDTAEKLRKALEEGIIPAGANPETFLRTIGADDHTTRHLLMALGADGAAGSVDDLQALVGELGPVEEEEGPDPFSVLDEQQDKGPSFAPIPQATVPDAADLDDSVSDLMTSEPTERFSYVEKELPQRTVRSMFDISQRQPVAEDAIWFQCHICGARVTDEWTVCPSCNTKLYSPTGRKK